MPQDQPNPIKKSWTAKPMPERRRQMLERAYDPESLPEEEFATFLLEQEIQPTVADDPKRVVRVRNV